MKKIPRVLGFPLTKVDGTWHCDRQFIISVAPSHVFHAGTGLYRNGWHARVSVYVGGGRRFGSEVTVEHRALTRRGAIAGLRRKIRFAAAGFKELGARAAPKRSAT